MATTRAQRRSATATATEYPHDDPRAWVPQQYRPPEVADHQYYRPSQHGREREIADRMARLHQSTEQPSDDA